MNKRVGFSQFQRVCEHHLRTENSNPENESLLSITKTFRYLADRTKPDVLVATGSISTGGAGSISTGGATNLSNEQVTTAERTISYLIQHSDFGLVLGESTPITVFGYADAAYITDGDAKNRLGDVYS